MAASERMTAPTLWGKIGVLFQIPLAALFAPNFSHKVSARLL